MALIKKHWLKNCNVYFHGNRLPCLTSTFMRKRNLELKLFFMEIFRTKLTDE